MPEVPLNNHQVASDIIAHLAALDVHAFFVSPGYRNAPFIGALTSPELGQHVSVYSMMDERAAAYAALSWAKVSDKPAVLCCTSGTALANYLPAVIEAHKSNVPLIILSADRPRTLIPTQANQVMTQTALFAQHCRLSLELPAGLLPNQRHIVASFVSEVTAATAWPLAGPVHLNCPFAEPLEPESCAALTSASGRFVTTHVTNTSPVLPDAEARALLILLRGCKRPLIVVGELREGQAELAEWLTSASLPVFADVISGIRRHVPAESLVPTDFTPVGRAFLRRFKPDFILWFGGRIVSRCLERTLAESPPQHHIVVNQLPGIPDPNHQITQVLRWSVKGVAQSLLADAAIPELPGQKLLPPRLAIPPKAPWSLYQAVAQIKEHIPGHHGVFLGNSSSIRACDDLGAVFTKVLAHRGVSGIEGHLASAWGMSLAIARPVTAILGDIAAIHDLNSFALLAAASHTAPVVAVIINNGGGRIFENLPIAAHRRIMDPLMTTPHKRSFAAIAEWAGLAYHLAQSPESLVSAYQHALQSAQSAIVEVAVPADGDAQFREFMANPGHCPQLLERNPNGNHC